MSVPVVTASEYELLTRAEAAEREVTRLREQLGKEKSPLNAIQFIALLEVLEECAIFVPGDLEARVYNLLDYHRDHDTASKLSHPDDLGTSETALPTGSGKD